MPPTGSQPANPGTIASLSNPRVKEVVKLRRRSHRDALGLLLVEGIREVSRAVASGHPLQTLFTCAGLWPSPSPQPSPPRGAGAVETLLARCREAGVDVITCTEPVFRKMAYREHPDGILAVAAQVRRELGDLVLSPCPLVVVIEAVEKPGNLGAILRSADAAGVDAVLVCDRCTDINNPNVVRASTGTLFSVPVVETSSPAAMQWLAGHGIQCVAATPSAGQVYTDADLSRPTALVLGPEDAGLGEAWLERADRQVRLPMQGVADSLNVAATATVLLFEAVRQRRPGKPRPPGARIAPGMDGGAC
jgi:TrmH family RNA methyltransferase